MYAGSIEHDAEPLVQGNGRHGHSVARFCHRDHVAYHILVSIGPKEPGITPLDGLGQAKMQENMELGDQLPSHNVCIKCLAGQQSIQATEP